MDTNVHCFNCTTILTPVFDNHDRSQYLDTLNVIFMGGYGTFYDDIANNLIGVVLCKECALKLCETFPKLKNLIPSNYLDPIQDIET